MAGLKGRGWTGQLIKLYAPEPTLARNPHYRNAPPMKLYDLDAIEEIESTDEFKKSFSKAAERSKKAVIVAERKAEANLAELERHLEHIHVDVLPIDKIWKYAVEERQEWNYMHDNFDEIIPSEVPKATKDRWIVNYIRHNLTYYDEYLSDIFGKVGKDKLYSTAYAGIMNAISVAYPSLANECRRQIEYKGI